MKAISVKRKVKVDGTWEMLPVARNKNGFDWSHLLFQGNLITTLPGTFYLDWREKGRRIRRAVGDHPRDAKAALLTQRQVLGLREEGMTVEDAPQIRPLAVGSGAKIAALVSDFRKHPPLTLRKKSYAKYRNALISFGSWTKKIHLNQLDRDDIKRYMSHLVDKEKLDPSTAVDKATIVLTVMNDRGAAIAMKKGDWPKVTETQREVYEHDTLEKLFAAADPYEHALFRTLLLSGFRDQEVGFLAWSDFNAKKCKLRVSKKTAMGFAPKNYQEREIPIPEVLVKILLEHKKRQSAGEYLIFPTSAHNVTRGLPGGQRDRHMLDRLKRLAKRAGLNCGHCKSTYLNKKATCATAPICQKFGLHMFRHTYATNMLHDGFDLVSLQFLLGHNDLASTRKYLRALAPKNMLEKINSSSLAKIAESTTG